jgi:2,3-bisphosphoglycerate-independent phosphoglycerate mutase
MSNQDIYDIAARLQRIAEGDLNQGAGPKFVGYLKGTDPASKIPSRLVGDSANNTALARKMSQIEQDHAAELDQQVETLYQELDKKKSQEPVTEKWSTKYKRSINCANPRGFSQRAHCQGRNKNESAVAEAAIGEDIMVKGSARDLKDFLDTVSKEKKIDRDLKDKDSHRGGDSLKPVDRITIGPNGEKTAAICGNMDDGFVVKVDEKEIGSGFASIDDAKRAIEQVHEQMMEQDTQSGAQDYMEER